MLAILLRSDPHGNPIQNQDVASVSKGYGSFLWFPYVLCLQIVFVLQFPRTFLVADWGQVGRERMGMILVDIRTEV